MHYTVKVSTILFFLGTCTLLAQANTTVYMTRDAQGNLSFSSHPSAGASAIQVENAQTFSSPPLPASSASAPAVATSAETLTRQASVQNAPTVDITIPANEGTLWLANGAVSVTVTVSPALQEKWSLQLLMDGSQVTSIVGPHKNPNITISISAAPVGRHTLLAQVIDESGHVLASSQSITAYFQQARNRQPVK